MLTQLLYASKSKLPSRHANSVQVAHMVCALAPLVKTMDVYLTGGWDRRVRLWMGQTFAHYGLSRPANARVHFIADSRRRPFTTVVPNVLPSQADLLITRSAPLALSWAERGRAVLFESHAPTRDADAVSIPRFIAALQSAPRSGVVGISEAVSATYQAWGLSPDKLLTAHDGVDLPAFARPAHFAPQAKTGAMARLFDPSIYDRPVMLYTGSLRPEKGAQFLVQAATALHDLHVAIVGGTPEECAMLRAKAGPRVFVHPSVPHKDIPALLHDADILAMPYLVAGELIPFMSPLKLFEYLASGTPLVAADIPVLRPIIEPDRNCLVFAPDSVAALRQAANTLLAMSVADRITLRERQLETAARHSWTQRARTILDWQETFFRTGDHHG